MIKFFRRIRQHLITQNKVSKYLLYAIGEIVLVVIGILIALSINNWNERNKTRKLEKSTLLEISNALQADLIQLNQWIIIRQKQDYNVSVILAYLQDNAPHSKEVDKAWQSGFLRPIYVFNTSPYDLLKSRGFDIIQNDELRRAIQQQYDISTPFMLDYLERNYDLSKDFRYKYLRHFRRGMVELEFTPTDLDALRSEEILNGLSILGFWHNNAIQWLNQHKERTEKLNIDIVEYLKTQLTTGNKR